MIKDYAKFYLGFFNIDVFRREGFLIKLISKD